MIDIKIFSFQGDSIGGKVLALQVASVVVTLVQIPASNSTLSTTGCHSEHRDRNRPLICQMWFKLSLPLPSILHKVYSVSYHNSAYKRQDLEAWTWLWLPSMRPPVEPLSSTVTGHEWHIFSGKKGGHSDLYYQSHKHVWEYHNGSMWLLVSTIPQIIMITATLPSNPR